MPPAPLHTKGGATHKRHASYAHSTTIVYKLCWTIVMRISVGRTYVVSPRRQPVFGFTTRPHPRPWLTGHEAEIKEWSDNISGIKRRFDYAKDTCDSNHHTGEDVETRDRLARELRTARRQKVNTLKIWEQHYWHSVGREAEIAEHRGDSYALYKIMNKLKLRGTTRRNLGANDIWQTTRWRKLRLGENIFGKYNTGLHQLPGGYGGMSKLAPCARI